MTVGDRIRTARIALNMTQEELGESIGVQKSAIAKYENGRVVNIKRSTLQKLAEVLRLPPSELIFGEAEDSSPDTSLPPAVQEIVDLCRKDPKLAEDLLYLARRIKNK